MTSSDLRIGMVSVDAPPHIGGIGRHVGSLLDGLKRIGVDVRLYDRSKRPMHYRLGKNVGFSFGLRRALDAWIHEEKIDLLHVHAGPGGVFLPFPPIPMIVTANHTYAQQSRLPWQQWKSLLRSAEWTTYLSARCVACISKDTADSLRSEYRIASDCIRTIPCGFDLTPWINVGAGTRNRKRCVFVGRADKRKGFDLLMAAWSLVRKAHPDTVLSVVGVQGADRDGMRFLGRISDAELQKLIGESQLLVAPSRLEGFGLAAAEAIAAGTPVVATDVSGLRTVVKHDVSGILTSLDPSAIAGAISSLLSDDALWSRMHLRCAHERSAFSLEREADAYHALYHEVYSSPTCATR